MFLLLSGKDKEDSEGAFQVGPLKGDPGRSTEQGRKGCPRVCEMRFSMLGFLVGMGNSCPVLAFCSTHTRCVVSWEKYGI